MLVSILVGTGSLAFGLFLGSRIRRTSVTNIRMVAARAEEHEQALEEKLQELKGVLAQLQDKGLDPYRANDILGSVAGHGSEPLARRWVKAAQQARDTYSKATPQLNHVAKAIEKDLGVLMGDEDVTLGVEGAAVLIAANLCMREARYRLEQRDLVEEFKEKFGEDQFTNELNWM